MELQGSSFNLQLVCMSLSSVKACVPVHGCSTSDGLVVLYLRTDAGGLIILKHTCTSIEWLSFCRHTSERRTSA